MAANLKKLMGYDVARQTFLVGSPQETVRDCMRRWYRKPGDEGLLQANVPADRSENKGPVRTLMGMEQERSANVRLVSGNKRASPGNKAPAFRVYNSNRPYGSSRSSMSSLHRRNERRRRTQAAEILPNLMADLGLKKPINPLVGNKKSTIRNQHMKNRADLPNQPNAISDRIRKDLLPLDKQTKYLIAVGNNEANEMAERMKTADKMNGWKYSATPQQFSARQLEQNIAQAELEEQYQHLKNISQLRQYETMRYSPNLANMRFALRTTGKHCLAAAYSKSVKEKHERILRLARENKEAPLSEIVAAVSAKDRTGDIPETAANGRTTKTAAISSASGAKPKNRFATEAEKQKNLEPLSTALATPTAIACSTIVGPPPPKINHFNRLSNFTGMKKL